MVSVSGVFYQCLFGLIAALQVLPMVAMDVPGQLQLPPELAAWLHSFAARHPLPIAPSDESLANSDSTITSRTSSATNSPVVTEQHGSPLSSAGAGSYVSTPRVSPVLAAVVHRVPTPTEAVPVPVLSLGKSIDSALLGRSRRVTFALPAHKPAAIASRAVAQNNKPARPASVQQQVPARRVVSLPGMVMSWYPVQQGIIYYPYPMMPRR